VSAGSTRLLAPLVWLLALACNDPAPMAAQDRYAPYDESHFFDDGRAMREPPAFTRPRERYEGAPVLRTGRLNGELVRSLPFPATRDILLRGEGRFRVYCATCHGLLGRGDSPVARNMPLRPPPSLIWHRPHASPEGALRVDAEHDHFAPGFVFQVITHGYGFMPSYANELSIPDRWAVIAYLEALRLSQRMTIAELPADVRERLVGKEGR
jgi:mono/diheme cytochrome c family protein